MNNLSHPASWHIETKAPRQQAKVRHYCPGGTEHGGGIGRLVGYIMDAAGGSVAHLVTDTRGPRLQIPGSLLRLAMAAAVLLRDRIAHPARIHHIHVAGRGSTARKLVLTALARLVGCAYILHLHDYDYASDVQRRPSWQRRLISAMFRKADRVIVLGEKDRRIVIDLLSVDPSRLRVLPNCVPDPGSRLDQPRAVPGILFLGRLSTRKGVPELIDALAAPGLAQLPWRATLAGDGPVEAFRKDVADRALTSRVTLPGWMGREEVLRLCRHSDILVLPSHAEGLAMAVIEGMSHGLAVITTRVGAHEEVITDGDTGLFVPVGDVPALAQAIARLLRDPLERARLAQAARGHFLRHHSMEVYMQRLDALYLGLELQPDLRAGAQ